MRFLCLVVSVFGVVTFVDGRNAFNCQRGNVYIDRGVGHGDKVVSVNNDNRFVGEGA